MTNEQFDAQGVFDVTRTPEFLKLNRFGQIPVLVLEDGRVLPESNAID